MVKNRGIKLYEKLTGSQAKGTAANAETKYQEGEDNPSKRNAEIPVRAASKYRAPLAETSKVADDFEDYKITSALNDDLRDFRLRLSSFIREKERANLDKLEKISKSIDTIRGRMIEVEKLLGRIDQSRDKRLILLSFQEGLTKDRVNAISSYLRSASGTFGSDLSVPKNIISIAFPVHDLFSHLRRPVNTVEDTLVFLDRGMLLDAHEKLDELEGIQRAIVKPAMIELRKLLEDQFLNECHKVVLL